MCLFSTLHWSHYTEIIHVVNWPLGRLGEPYREWVIFATSAPSSGRRWRWLRRRTRSSTPKLLSGVGALGTGKGNSGWTLHSKRNSFCFCWLSLLTFYFQCHWFLLWFLLSFPLLTLDLICASFSCFLRWKRRWLILDPPSFPTSCRTKRWRT